MRYWIRNRRLARRTYPLFHSGILPGVAFSQKASIRDVQVKAADGNWKVSFSVENCFTGEDGRGHPDRDSYDLYLLSPALSGEKLVEGSEGDSPFSSNTPFNTAPFAGSTR